MPRWQALILAGAVQEREAFSLPNQGNSAHSASWPPLSWTA